MLEVIKWKHQWACPNDRIVWVIVKKLDEAWKKDKGCYLRPGSCLNNRVGEWFVKLAAAKERVPMPLIGYYEEKIMFTDGRHRFGWCRDNGIRAMPVSVESNAQVRLIGKLFGSKSRVCRIPVRHQRELMKATKGWNITCNVCRQAVGKFIKDVPVASPVTSNDVDMDTSVSIPSHLDGGRKWKCQKCSAVVSELADQSTNWRVHTGRRGWLA